MNIVPTAADFGYKSGSKATGQSDLGQADFLRLMTEQLRNQDPLKPLDSNQFLGQLAQFSTVQGIQGLQNSFASFANAQMDEQALQAASLIGRNVLISSSSFRLDEGGTLQGETQVPYSGRVDIEITDASGAVVRTMQVDAQQAGTLELNWDGLRSDGSAAPPGVYRVQARMQDRDTTYALETQVYTRIESVSFGTAGLSLNLSGGGSVPLSAVRRIG